MLRDGGRPDRRAHPDRGADVPKTASAASAQSAVAGVEASGTAVATAPTGTAERPERVVLLAIPTAESTNTVGEVTTRSVRTAVAKPRPACSASPASARSRSTFLHAVYGNFPLMLGIIALLTFVLLARAFRSLLLPLKAVMLNLVSLAAVYGAMVLFWQDGHGSNAIFGIHGHRRGHLLDPADGLRVPVRPVDGLRGLHPVPDARGVRRDRLDTDGRGHRGHRPHRPAGHLRGADPVPRVRRAGLRRRAPT